ncbi:hypothetical protein ACIA98_34480 [Streptomyces sp. NPDC051366]|uniref:hypothetical protein n=1 Tax=Streptomyces sp. NPDC051366 TaxID=3365652 RepID=UPI00379CAE0A
MPAEALAALAAAGGAAVVEAAGTSAWQGFQQAVARWFAGGDEDREHATLERLDSSANALAATGGNADDSEAERIRIAQQAIWQARFEVALEDLSAPDREEAAETLRILIAGPAAPGRVSASGGAAAVGGNVTIRADHGSAAAWHMGTVTLGSPPPPGPQQGCGRDTRQRGNEKILEP